MTAGDRRTRTPRCSILWPAGTDPLPLRDSEPDFFEDLNLDSLVAAAQRGRADHHLAPFFHTHLVDQGQVRYRQAVGRDLERPDVRAVIDGFADTMRQARRHRSLSTRVSSPQVRRVWFLHAAHDHARAVAGLAEDLQRCDLHSQGMRDVRAHVVEHASSAAFRQLLDDAATVLDALAGVEFSVHVADMVITVSPPEEGIEDYSEQIAASFERFRQQGDDDDHDRAPEATGLSEVESRIVELVGRLHADVFGELERFCEQHADHADPTILAFDREVQFYLAYHDLIAPARAAGLPLCYPEVTPGARTPEVRETFDLALARSGIEHRIVTNDLVLHDPERIVVVTGANQGGKTTFLRTVGQVHHLARLGLPVPGRHARLGLCDEILTHFPRQERPGDLRGRLLDDLVRLHDVLDRATPDSLVILNETFGSTTLADARAIGAEVMQHFVDRDVLCLYATFIDELAMEGATTVSMVATVDPDDPALRTFRIVREAADGRAYASAIARTYRLTYEALRERIGS